MTFDFLFGFATPGSKIVLQSPSGIRGWFVQGMAKKWTARDGFVYMAAARLLGITIGVTITRECDNSSLPQFSSPPVQMPAMAVGGGLTSPQK
jgi:hypothetical protein